MHRRQRRRRLHRPLNRLLVIAAVLVPVAAFVCGCGNGEEEPTAAETSAGPNYHRQIKEARDEIAELEQRAREQAGGSGGSGAETERPSPGGRRDPTSRGELEAMVSELESRLGAELGVAVSPIGGGSVATAGSLQTGAAWSTSKVLIVLRVIEDAGGPEGLDAEQEQLIHDAITLSDNAAAASLFAELGARYGGTAEASRALDEVLRAGGDEETEVSIEGRDGFSSYGQTLWSLDDQAGFTGQLAAGCAADSATTDYVLAEMGQVTSDVWGLGSLPGDDEWKGGWGPGTDGRYLVRQMGVIELARGGEAAIAIAAEAGDGSFESAQSAATSLARGIYRAASAGHAGGGC